ncbi:MAG: DUF5652 family protein [Betaproteobacteria bacterium]|nr:DUF5652 family protein [Betaproteobacteria bacterium]
MSIVPNLPHWMIVWLPLAIVWDLVWKGLGLWRAARRGQTLWFICMLALNTVGILPIVYLLVTRRATGRVSPTR